jgi:uncharacterized membrane protein YeaQ/YmgE (transglycosylase-associated protein family)
MSWLWAAAAGLVIGVIARLIAPGKQSVPIWLTVVIGIAGALVGNALASALGVRTTTGIDWTRHILQVIVAVAGVYVAAALRTNTRR